jgi:hypothetical protein
MSQLVDLLTQSLVRAGFRSNNFSHYNNIVSNKGKGLTQLFLPISHSQSRTTPENMPEISTAQANCPNAFCSGPCKNQPFFMKCHKKTFVAW